MPITDPAAIKFSNEHVRGAANRLANCYYRALALSDQWTALGSGQPALDALANTIADYAGYFIDTHRIIHKSGLTWQSFQSQAGAVPVENTAEAIVDGSPDDSRPAITGAQANNVINRIQEFLNWGDLGAFTAAANKGGGGAWLYTILDVSPDGRTADLTAAGLFITRCNELVTDYEASSNAKLNTLLAVAPVVEIV